MKPAAPEERRQQFEQIDLPPIDRGDHRPQDEGEIAGLARAVEQPANQLGPHERFLAARVDDLDRRRRRVSGLRHDAGPSGADDCRHGVRGREATYGAIEGHQTHYCIKYIKKGL